jgi:aminocarboxymuconate-semialdehyde decarboxylase
MTIDRRTLIGAAAAAGVTTTVSGGPARARTKSTAKVIDVHTHMFSRGWMDVVDASNDPTFRLGKGDQDGALIYRGRSVGRIVQPMIDFDLRIKDMDAAGVDIALISLTAPNVYWGTQKQSAAAARAINDDFRAAEQKYDGRIRWMASLPWQYADDAIEELKRARKNGAIGVCMLSNILGTNLTDEPYKPIWREIEAMGLPVFIHPTTSYVDYIGQEPWGLFNSIGFITDTTLCFDRMINSGFMDEFPKLKMIACHGGGYLPYLSARLDQIWDRAIPPEYKAKDAPSSYMPRLWYDSIVYDQETLEFLIKRVGVDKVMYGSDYPFRIGDMPGNLKRVDALPPDQRDALRSGNALKLFDL